MWTGNFLGGRKMNMITNMIVDYGICEECSNYDAFYICHKCGECGRVFDGGFLVDTGGTTEKDCSEE